MYLKNNNFYYLITYHLLYFFIFVLLLIISLEAEDISFSIKSSLFYFRIGIFSCFIWYLIEKDKNILTYFYYVLILCFSALVMMAIINILHEKNFWISNNQFVFHLFWDEAIMGSYLSRLFPLLFAFIFIKKKNKFEIYLYRTFIYLS